MALNLKELRKSPPEIADFSQSARDAATNPHQLQLLSLADHGLHLGGRRWRRGPGGAGDERG